MAITLIEAGGQANSPDQKVYMISSEADLMHLPTTHKEGVGVKGHAAPLSMAVTNEGKTFVLGDDDVWREW